jgi:hypothetical protein
MAFCAFLQLLAYQPLESGFSVAAAQIHALNHQLYLVLFAEGRFDILLGLQRLRYEIFAP